MLKTCFECLVGTNNNPVDHDTYGTRLNGNTQTTMWSTAENEEVFKLPRPLTINDTIGVGGNFLDNRNRLLFKLKSGTPAQGNQDSFLQIEVDFLNDTIRMSTNISGSQDANGLKPSEILDSSKFSLNLKFKENSNGFEDRIVIDVNMGGMPLDVIEQDRNALGNVTFFTLSYGVIEVKDLTFTYA